MWRPSKRCLGKLQIEIPVVALEELALDIPENVIEINAILATFYYDGNFCKKTKVASVNNTLFAWSIAKKAVPLHPKSKQPFYYGN